MKTPACLLRLLAMGILVLFAGPAHAGTITDGFNHPSAWAKPLLFSKSCDLFVGSGRMNFTNASNDNGTAGIARISPTLPVDKDWSMQVDAHVQPFVLNQTGQFCDVFLGFGKTGDWVDNRVMFEFCRGRWDQEADDYDVGDDICIGGKTMPELFSIDGLSSPDVSLRMDYAASAHRVSFYVDHDGASNGHQWILQGSANLAAGVYDMGMKTGDTFTPFLSGSSRHQIIRKGDAWLDNLRITTGTAAVAPDIAVEFRGGKRLISGNPRLSVGSIVGQTGYSGKILILNEGTKNLSGIRVSLKGVGASNFSIIPQPKALLKPGEVTSFKVAFKPTSAGARTAMIRIHSNDPDDNPYKLRLVGKATTQVAD